MDTMPRSQELLYPDLEPDRENERVIAANFDRSFEIAGGEVPASQGWLHGPARGGTRELVGESARRGATPPRTSRDRRPLIRYVVQNRTPYLIRIPHVDRDRYGELVIPPLDERVVAGSRLEPFEQQLRLYRQRHEVSVRPYRQERRSVGSLLLLASLLGLLAVVAWDFLYRGTIRTWEFWIALVVAATIWCVVLVRAKRSENLRRTEALNIDSEGGDIAAGMGSSSVDANETARRGFHYLVLLTVVTIGAVLPSIAILVATDTYGMVDLDGGFRVDPGLVSPFTSRLIQMIYVSILSLFPALMYFQFDRQRFGTIWGQWVRAIFRMDGRMRTLADVNARYGGDLVEASNNSAKSVRYFGGNHSPIVISTILIALGWTVLVLQTESFNFEAVVELRKQEKVLAAAEASAESSRDRTLATDDVTEAQIEVARSEAAVETAEAASAQSEEVAADALVEDGSPPSDDGSSGAGTETDPGGDAGPAESIEVTTIDEARDEAQDNLEAVAAEGELAAGARDQVLSTDYFQLLVPRPSAAAMAFLGAYFFAVYLVLRSYFRGDLRPKLYNQITARLVTVVVLAYLINVLLVDSEQQAVVWSLAFLAGVVPQTVLKRLLTFGRLTTDRLLNTAFSEERPLSQIDGVDLYDSNVLEAEGVSDIPALANSDLASVMMRSRLPIDRLVDWADQAVLLTVLSGDGAQLSPEISEDRKRGERTASDFMAKCSCSAFTQRDLEPTCVGADGADADSADESSATVDGTMCEKCAAMRRTAVWPSIERWRTSELACRDEWIPLPPWRERGGRVSRHEGRSIGAGTGGNGSHPGIGDHS